MTAGYRHRIYIYIYIYADAYCWGDLRNWKYCECKCAQQNHGKGQTSVNLREHRVRYMGQREITRGLQVLVLISIH